MNLTNLFATPRMPHVRNKDVNMSRRHEDSSNLQMLNRQNVSEEGEFCRVTAEMERIRAERAAVIEDLRQMREDNHILLMMSSIETALRTGRRLSQAEFDFLKEHAPELYTKAREIERERDAYRRELENARSKEEVSRIHMRRAMQFATEAQMVMRSDKPQAEKLAAMESIFMRMVAIFDEHRNFVQSRRFMELPDECEFRSLYISIDLTENEIEDPVQFLNDLFVDWGDDK